MQDCFHQTYLILYYHILCIYVRYIVLYSECACTLISRTFKGTFLKCGGIGARIHDLMKVKLAGVLLSLNEFNNNNNNNNNKGWVLVPSRNKLVFFLSQKRRFSLPSNNDVARLLRRRQISNSKRCCRWVSQRDSVDPIKSNVDPLNQIYRERFGTYPS